MRARDALTFGCLLLSLFAPAAMAQGVPHVEKCTLTENWDVQGGTFGVKNVCDEVVSIEFMTEKNQRAVRADLNPGARFDTGLSRSQIGSGLWMFTTCPAGMTSDIAVTWKNRAALVPGEYKCVRKPRAESQRPPDGYPV